jgi:protein-tyrosine-phosphatase
MTTKKLRPIVNDVLKIDEMCFQLVDHDIDVNHLKIGDLAEKLGCRFQAVNQHPEYTNNYLVKEAKYRLMVELEWAYADPSYKDYRQTVKQLKRFINKWEGK